MKQLRIIRFLCFLILFGNTQLIATTMATPESVTIHSVESFLRTFKNANGRYPTNWAEFGPTFNLNRINEQYLKGTDAYPLQQHYLFVSDKLPMLGLDEGDVLLIRVEPVPNSLRENEIGRYIISKTEEGLKFNWYSEEKVQQMLAKAGVTELPKPELWPTATNNAVHSQSSSTSNFTEPDVKPPKDEKSSATFQPSQNINPTNEIAVASSPKEKSWGPVFVVLGVGAILFFIFKRTRKR